MDEHGDLRALALNRAVDQEIANIHVTNSPRHTESVLARAEAFHRFLKGDTTDNTQQGEYGGTGGEQ